MYIYIYIYSGPQGGFTARPFFFDAFWNTTLWTQRVTESGAVLGCKKAPKREPKWTPRAHKGPQYGSKGCQDGLKGGQICPTNSFKARRVFETAPGPILWHQKGPKRVPKWIQNGVRNRAHFQTFSCSNLGSLLAPVGDPIRDTTTWRRRR